MESAVISGNQVALCALLLSVPHHRFPPSPPRPLGALPITSLWAGPLFSLQFPDSSASQCPGSSLLLPSGTSLPAAQCTMPPGPPSPYGPGVSCFAMKSSLPPRPSVLPPSRMTSDALHPTSHSFVAASFRKPSYLFPDCEPPGSRSQASSPAQLRSNVCVHLRPLPQISPECCWSRPLMQRRPWPSSGRVQIMLPPSPSSTLSVDCFGQYRPGWVAPTPSSECPPEYRGCEPSPEQSPKAFWGRQRPPTLYPLSLLPPQGLCTCHPPSSVQQSEPGTFLMWPQVSGLLPYWLRTGDLSTLCI